jgi:hypothetical protein
MPGCEVSERLSMRGKEEKESKRLLKKGKTFLSRSFNPISVQKKFYEI